MYCLKNVRELIMLPAYSVLMSVYAKEKPENLRESIKSMVEQTVEPDDFVIVCDGQLTSALYLVIDEFKEKYPYINVIYTEKNKGLASALQNGLNYCKNDIVARMDSDDIALPNRMQLQLNAFSKKNADIVSGTIAEFDSDPEHILNYRILPKTCAGIKNYSRRRNPFNHPCTAFRKQQVYMAGGYEECRWFEDYYLWLRMLRRGCKAYNIRQPILYMRAGKGMYSRRGGLEYTHAALRFRKRMYKEGFCSFGDFIYTCAAHIAVGLIPNRLRIFVYSKFLRKTVTK